MNPINSSKPAAKYVSPRHDTVEDVSWDLGSLEHRIEELENVVKEMKANINQLQAELRDMVQEKSERPSTSDSSTLFQDNGSN